MAQIKAEKTSGGLDTLGIEETMKALTYSIRSNQPINLIGPPGVGKSAIVANSASNIGLPFEPLILSLCDPTDIGGFPVANNGTVDRLPLGVIKRACKEPVCLFLDELSTASPAVQGAALRLVYERWAGDVRLHPDTVIVAACNPPDQAAGGWELALPLIGRMTQLHMRPKIKEVQEFFYNLGVEGTRLRYLAVDFAATMEMAPDLVQIDPPSGAQSSGRAWGAPRSWERALRVCAQALEGNETDVSPIFAALLAGNIGEDSAASYMTIRKVRQNLPSIKEILTKPFEAKVPVDSNSQIAVLGILAQVAQTDPCPAWVYTNRLKDEARIASMNVMGRFGINKHKTSAFYEDAESAQKQLLRSMGEAIRGQ